jgi:heptosyltransferase-2
MYGGIEERNTMNYFLERIPGKFINLIGCLNLEQTAYYISRMNIFVSNDTGLMHIAASQDIPLIAIFGPTDQIKSCPIVSNDKKLILINKKLSCSPCYPHAPLKFCKGRVDCLNLITPEEVLTEINEMVNIFKGINQKAFWVG